MGTTVLEYIASNSGIINDSIGKHVGGSGRDLIWGLPGRTEENKVNVDGLEAEI
jgi:hypothetical protein